jgi:flavin reductase (DIM6/NTAB) family NADH-FMN oxidoreductase RutF
MWQGIEVRDDDPRLLSGAAGWLTARTIDELPTGDHTFFVAEILTMEEAPEPTSLIYVHRGYKPV